MNNSTLILFESIKLKFKKQGWDISYMKLRISNKCINTNGKIINTMNPNSCAGSWTTSKIIYLGDDDHLIKVQNYYNVSINLNKFKRLIIAHELAHEVWTNILTNQEKDQFIQLTSNFTTPYIDSLDPNYSKLNEEKFCEYIASRLN